MLTPRSQKQGNEKTIKLLTPQCRCAVVNLDVNMDLLGRVQSTEELGVPKKEQEPILIQNQHTTNNLLFTNTTPMYTNQCAQTEQYSRTQRVNTLIPRNPHFPHLKLNSSPCEIVTSTIALQFENVFTPRWFGTVEWIPFIRNYDEAVRESRHFMNKFFSAMFCTKLKKIPFPPHRPRIIWFHEKKSVVINPNHKTDPRYRSVFHSHFHLGECPDPFNDVYSLDALVSLKVAPRFRRLSTNRSKENQAVVIKPWILERHAFYNLKDYHQSKYKQDADLVLDYENSDLEFPNSK